jgi:hypothetical protein
MIITVSMLTRIELERMVHLVLRPGWAPGSLGWSRKRRQAHHLPRTTTVGQGTTARSWLAIAMLAMVTAGCVGPSSLSTLRELLDRAQLAEPAERAGPSSALHPGAVGRTSARLEVDTRIDVWLQPRRSRIVATARLGVRNTSGRRIDRIVLRSAERLPTRVTRASVDGHEVTARVRPGRITVPFGGVLPAGESVAVELDLALGLGRRVRGGGYFHALRDGVLQVSEWLPRVNPAFSKRIRARVHARDGMAVAVGSLENAREVAIAASTRYRRLQATIGGTRIRVLYGPGGRAAAEATIREARRVLPWISRRLGPQPRDLITFAQINSDGLAYSWPGLIWLPDDLTPAGVRLYVAHELAHQWFGGIASTADPLREPFAAEGPAEVVSRLFLDALRPGACPGRRLDRPKSAYGGCFYESIYVDGANLLDRVRRRMGDGRFWRALRAYLREHRFRPVGTTDLLRALRRASPADLDVLLRDRFPSLMR